MRVSWNENRILNEEIKLVKHRALHEQLDTRTRYKSSIYLFLGLLSRSAYARGTSFPFET